MSAERPAFESFEGKDGQWYWHLQAVNGEIVAQSEGYPDKEAADDGIEACKRNVLAALGINTRRRQVTSTIETIEEAGGKLSVTVPETVHWVCLEKEQADEVPV